MHAVLYWQEPKNPSTGVAGMPVMVRRLSSSVYVLYDPALKRLIYLCGWDGGADGPQKVS